MLDQATSTLTPLQISFPFKTPSSHNQQLYDVKCNFEVLTLSPWLHHPIIITNICDLVNSPLSIDSAAGSVRLKLQNTGAIGSKGSYQDGINDTPRVSSRFHAKPSDLRNRKSPRFVASLAVQYWGDGKFTDVAVSLLLIPIFDRS
jgi:hypothetical protein